jgi:hypothetical protein
MIPNRIEMIEGSLDVVKELRTDVFRPRIWTLEGRHPEHVRSGQQLAYRKAPRLKCKRHALLPQRTDPFCKVA